MQAGANIDAVNDQGVNALQMASSSCLSQAIRVVKHVNPQKVFDENLFLLLRFEVCFQRIGVLIGDYQYNMPSTCACRSPEFLLGRCRMSSSTKVCL